MSKRGIVVVALCGMASSAAAQAPAWPGATPATQPPPAADTRPYRGQMATADAICFGALIFPPLGLTGYATVGPLIHVAHGHPGRALASVSLRIGTPLAFAVIAAFGVRASASDDRGDFHDDGGDIDEFLTVLGAFAVGMITAMLIDDLGLAGPSQPEPLTRRPVPRVTLTPRVIVSPEQTTLGFALRF